MDCPECNAQTGYRFFTGCPQCSAEVWQAKPLDQKDFPGNSERGNLIQNRPRLLSALANSIYVLALSLTGMVIGAVLIYFLAGITYVIVDGGEVRNSQDCARGMLVGWLSILLGAFLGTVSGSAIASTHPILQAGGKY